MSQATQDLTYNITGQSFIFDAPYRPSSVTSVTVLPWDAGDDDTAETATTGSASIESVDTTFDANSGVSSANRRTCNLAATTNIILDRKYLAVNAANEYEFVDVTGITSGASVQARTALLNDYVSGDTFQGTRISISVLDAWIQNDQKISDSVDANPGYRIAWVWVGTPPGGASTTTRSYTYADVVRSPGQHFVTPADMERFLPGWVHLLPAGARDDTGRQLIQAAYEDVKFRLLQAGVPDQQVRNHEALAHLVKHAARAILFRNRFDTGGSFEAYEEARREYVALVSGFFTVTSRVPVGTTSSGAGAQPKAAGLWSR